MSQFNHSLSPGHAAARRPVQLFAATLVAGLSLGAAPAALAQTTTLVAGFHENFSANNQNSLTIFGVAGTTGVISSNAGFSQDFTIGAEGFSSLMSAMPIRSSP